MITQIYRTPDQRAQEARKAKKAQRRQRAKDAAKAAAAAIAATAIIAFSAGHQAATTAEAEAARTEARTGDLVRSASLCQEAGGHWYTTANGAPRCDTNATVRTRLVSGSESCAGRKRKEANNITVCDEAK